nr:MAG: hypothetical protein OI719_00345 [Candidatus Methanoperedens sp.]
MEDEKFSDKVFATADQAVGHGGEKVPVLGYLIWYSIKESRMKITDLRRIFTQVGISSDFIPEETSKINAFKRATSELSEEIEVEIEPGKTAVYMVRTKAKSDDELVKSVIKEIRDATNKTLEYKEIGRAHFDKDTEDVRYFDLETDSQPVTTQIKQLYSTYCSNLTGKQIRAVFHEIIQSMSPTLVRPSGAVYFIPYVHADMVQKMEVLSKELGAFGITDFESAFESIPLIDADKTRALVEVRFEEQNTRDADRTLVELSKMLQGTDATPKTAAKYVEQVKAAKENIARYEGLLNKEMSVARMKVEVLDGQVQKLIEKIAQQPIVQPAKKESKKEAAGTPAVAIVVPHHETAQASAAPAEAVVEAGAAQAPAAEIIVASVPATDKGAAPFMTTNSTIVLVQTPGSGFTSQRVPAVEQPVIDKETKEPEKDIQLFIEPMVQPVKEAPAPTVQTALTVVEPEPVSAQPAPSIAVLEPVVVAQAPVTAAVSDVQAASEAAVGTIVEGLSRAPEGSGVLVLSETVLDRESAIEVQAEAAAQQEVRHGEYPGITERPGSAAEFTTESLLLS